MGERLGRVRMMRITVLVMMALGLIGLGGMLFRNLVNTTSDFGFGALYVLVPLVLVCVIALFVSAFKISTGKD